MKSPHLFLLLALVAGPLQAQTPRDVTVSAPTRLDWQFAAHGFGSDAGKVPKDFDSTRQRYQLYVPKVEKKPEAWPLILFVSAGDKPAGLDAWKKVCEANGVLFCSPYAAGNPVPAGQRTRIILDVLDDVRRQFPVNPDQTYISGFSGGGRMACAIGLALPECFGGIAPICGTNPLTKLAFLRHRAEERLSLAFITGEKDFNRKETETFMHRWMEDVGVRTEKWVVPGMGHAIPGDKVLSEVYDWLQRDLKRRRSDSKRFPGFALLEGKDLGGAALAARVADEGFKQFDDPKRIWRAVATLQFVTQRWPKSEAAGKAREKLGTVLKDEALLERIAEQGDEDERLSLTAQARAFERFGLTKQAIEAWTILMMSQPGSPAAKEAEAAIKRLKK